MNRTMVFASAGALATALVVAMLLSALMGGKGKEPSQEILVARKDVAIGTKLDSSNTRWQKWPNAASVPGALVRSNVKEEAWKDQKIRRALTKDEPITQGALVSEIKGSYLAAALEPGMRAVTIDVKAASGVAGFISPNDRVDVILVYSIRVQSNNGEAALQELFVDKASETVLENARILATDQDAAGNTGGAERKAKVSKTITLEVSPADAEKLILAAEMGELRLSLRQLGDTKKGVTLGQTTTDVSVGRVLKKAITMRGKSENPAAGIRVYSPNGAQVVPLIQRPEPDAPANDLGAPPPIPQGATAQ